MKGTSSDGAFVTEAQVLASVPGLTARRLRRWRDWGLVPTPERRFPGRPKGGSTSWYRQGATQSASFLNEALARGRGRRCWLWSRATRNGSTDRSPTGGDRRARRRTQAV